MTDFRKLAETLADRLWDANSTLRKTLRIRSKTRNWRSKMKNYRIQKLSYDNYVRYVPQKKVLGLFWWNMFIVDFTQYHSYESANRALCSYLKGFVVENLDVNCGENK